MSTFPESTVKWAIEHLGKHHDTDIFPRAFEYEVLRAFGDDVATWLGGHDVCQWPTRARRQCLVPKQRYGFRVATQLDPLDMLVYMVLVLELGEDIESARIPRGNCVAFASRFNPSDETHKMFDEDYTFRSFQRHSGELADSCAFVAVTDIADFYSRIYIHPLEVALRSAAPDKSDLVTGLLNLRSRWYQKVSYGLPVGSEPSRLLAELVLNDVDRVLLADGRTFCRYVDDYRFFCDSREEAYGALSSLANTLYSVHGLTLQMHKTDIMSVDEFRYRVLRSEQSKELDSIAKGFDDIIARLGLEDPYEELDYNSLDDEEKELVDALNLEDMLHAQLAERELDVLQTRFLLHRLGLLRRTEPLDEILAQLDTLYPVLGKVIWYLDRVRQSLSESEREAVGEALLAKLDGSVLSQLEFNRMLLMSPFAGSADWGHGDRLPRYQGVAVDGWFQRSLMLALGRSGQDYWLRSRRREVGGLPPWEQRAFVYAASCLHRDEKKAFYASIRPTVDRLCQWVVDWSGDNAINEQAV